MLPKAILGGGAILLAAFITLTEALSLPTALHYVWALLAFVWGILILMKKD